MEITLSTSIDPIEVAFVRKARLVAAHGPRRFAGVVRDGRRIGLHARLRDGGRLRIVQLGR